MILVSVSQKDRFLAQKEFLRLIEADDVIYAYEESEYLEISSDTRSIRIKKSTYFDYLCLRKRLFKALREFNLSKIVVNSDRTLNIDLLFCHFGMVNRIPCISPCLTVSTKEALIKYRLKNLDCFEVKSNFKGLLLRLVGNNMVVHGNRRLCFYRLKEVLRILMWRLSVTDPWTLGANYPITLYASCFFTRDLLLSNGVSEGNIELTLSKDYRLLKTFKDSEISYDVCFSFTPYWEHSLESFANSLHYQVLILEGLRQAGYKVCIALHPKCDLKNYNSHLTGYDVFIGETPRALMSSKILIAFYSSIVAWSLYAIKPCIIYDPFKYKYSFLDAIIQKPNVCYTSNDVLNSLKTLPKAIELEKLSINNLGININSVENDIYNS
jgi:hypothetical protein